MPETRTPNSDFSRAFGDAKNQAVGVAGEISDAGRNLYAKQLVALPRSPMPPVGPRGKLPVHLRRHCATRLKISHMRLS